MAFTIVWLLLILTGIWDLFRIPHRSIIWFFSFLLLVFIYSKFKKVPNYAHLFLSLIALLNIFGEVFFGLYYSYFQYDKLLHFVDPIFACIFIYHLAKPKIKNKKFLIMFCIFASISVAVGWEILEYGFDNTFGSIMQGVYIRDITGLSKYQLIIDKNEDTMVDISLGLIGIIMFSLFKIGRYKLEKRREK